MEKTQISCNLEVAENPFLIHPGRVSGWSSLSLGSLSTPKWTNDLSKNNSSNCEHIKIPPLFFRYINATKDHIFYGSKD